MILGSGSVPVMRMSAMEYLGAGFVCFLFAYIILKGAFGVDLFDFPWGLFDAPEREEEEKTRPQIVVDEAALPQKARGLFSALKDFEQIFTEDRRYTAASIFKNRDPWLQKFKALVEELAVAPAAADTEKMSRLWKEADKMEKFMTDFTVTIREGANIHWLKKDLLALAPYDMEGIVVHQQRFVSEGKRMSSLVLLLRDGDEVGVLANALRSGGGVPVESDSDDEEAGENPEKEEGVDGANA